MVTCSFHGHTNLTSICDEFAMKKKLIVQFIQSCNPQSTFKRNNFVHLKMYRGFLAVDVLPSTSLDWRVTKVTKGEIPSILYSI